MINKEHNFDILTGVVKYQPTLIVRVTDLSYKSTFTYTIYEEPNRRQIIFVKDAYSKIDIEGHYESKTAMKEINKVISSAFVILKKEAKIGFNNDTIYIYNDKRRLEIVKKNALSVTLEREIDNMLSLTMLEVSLINNIEEDSHNEI